MRKAPIIVAVIIIALCGFGGFAFKAMQDAKNQAKPDPGAVVDRGDLEVKVVDSGTLDAIKVVELKSRASGRLQQLLKDEGDRVKQGDLIAIIDPQETEFKVEQDSAQLRGAQSGVARQTIEIGQRRVTVAAALRQAQSRLAQLEMELKVQPTLTNSAITQARASLESAQQERRRLIESAHPNMRVSAEAAVVEAQANYENSKADEARQKELLAKGYVAQRVVENAQLSVRLAETRLNTAKQNLARLDAQLQVERTKADDDVRRAQAELDRATANRIQDSVKRKEYENAQAEVDRSRAALRDVDAMIQARAQSQAGVAQLQSVLSDSRRQLGETRIVSPITGIITKKLIQEGELVAALSGFSAGTSIVRIEDRTAMLVKLNINEIDVAKLATGLDAEITVDAFPSDKFTGTVRKIAPASNNLTTQVPSADTVVKYQVEIALTNPSDKLRSGMSAKCSLVVAKREKVLRLPVAYVGKDEKGNFVNLAPAKKDAAPVRKDIQVGLTTGTYAEILSGVKEGDKIVKPKYSGPEREGMMRVGGPRD
ncbi:MAG TPA: efflux RND transporter periplasmic adaptor subunit [Fimbriimonadaceae bacterium]|nr:efflux RND transporter periplasmic adaptor subunit [Fimbriimonadaceae bacterium]